MNIVNKLTLRQLKQNKRRTLVTIIGVVISVAMITAVATIAISFMELMQRQTIADEGEWHVLYKNVNKDQLAAVKKDEATKTVVISKDLGYAPLKGSQNDNKPYLFIEEYNAEGFEQFPIKLSKGRLPQAADEIVISEEIASNAKVEYAIGDSLTLNVGKRISKEEEHILLQQDPFFTGNKEAETLQIETTATYKIVGIIKRPEWEPTWAPGYTIISYIDESLIGADDTVNASVILKKVKSSLYAHAKNLAEENSIESIKYNNGLLRYYGVTSNDGLRSTLYSLSAIIMAIIIVGSVSLIYNAFAISVSERSRHLGMLSSVGATNRQKKNSVFFEGMIIGLISIPLGFICGLIGIGITFGFINSAIQGALGVTEKLTVSVTPLSILIACVVSMLTIFISTYLPARKASKISAIDAIRQTTDIKLTGKAVKTSKLVRKLFGIEAEIGLKNLKRNKRRYQATVFSLVISIVLFLTVSYFTDSLKRSLMISQEGVNYDMQVSFSSQNRISGIDEQLIQSITALKDVTEFSMMKEASAYSWIDEAFIADELRDSAKLNNNMLKDGKFSYVILIHSLNEESLQAYAKEVGMDYKKLMDPDHLAAIVIDTISYQDKQIKKYVETNVIHTKIGQSFDFYAVDRDTEKEIPLSTIEVAALTDKIPMGVRPNGLGVLDIVVSEQVMDKLLEKKAYGEIRTNLFLKSKDPLATQQQIEEMKERSIYVHNVYKNRKQEEQMIMLMSVFTYGFILLITAILGSKHIQYDLNEYLSAET